MPSTKLSSWRLWLCCHPFVTPPHSDGAHNEATIGPHELEELDPHNRLATPTPPPRAQRVTFAPVATEPSTPKSQATGDRQRPHTVLLPSPPQLRLKRSPKKQQAVGMKEPKKGKLLRMDSRPELGEKWWQMGKKATPEKRN